MQVTLHHPLDGFYQGTRFDRSGLFKSLLLDGTELCGDWFEHYSPTLHDAVRGPAEEFSLMSFEGLWLKIGVGLLRPTEAPYDRFRLYDIAVPGRWEMDGMRFKHYLEGCYDYTKELVITGDRSFVLRHHLLAFTALKGEVYNHNFFTLGKMEVGPSRRIDFPFRAEGDWRAPYDSVAFRGKGIRFSRKLEKGESVYTGDVHRAGCEGMPYEMRLSEGPLSVSIRGDVPVTRTVLWANHRIACLEPYNSIDLRSGERLRWSIEYTFSHA